MAIGRNGSGGIVGCVLAETLSTPGAFDSRRFDFGAFDPGVFDRSTVDPNPAPLLCRADQE